jgi:hypothetical protein
VKLTKPTKKEIEEKEREIEGKKRKQKKKRERTKENSRERWWMIKEQTRQPNL